MHVISDPLLELISKYREGCRVARGLPEPLTDEEEEEQILATYGPWQDKLCNFDQPAQSINGVREAIRLAIEEDAIIDMIAERSLISALRYLDQVA